MKAIAKFLTVITILVLLACAYVIRASELKVVPAGGVIESAADRAQAFDSILESARVGSSALDVYDFSVSGGAEQYIFITYTLNLRNMNALPAEWLQLDITPQEGDVLTVLPTVEDVPAFSQEYLTVVLLTDRNTASRSRSAVLTYYVYGHEFKLPVQLSL